MNSSIPKYNKLILTCTLLFLIGIISAQSYSKSYELHGRSESSVESNMDCSLEKVVLNNGKEAMQFNSRPLFIYASEEFKQWSAGNYLLETEAYIYKTNKQVFLVFDFQFNTINAKKTYGSIDQKAQFKVYWQNGESIYLKNIEKDKGRISRDNNTTYYQGAVLLDKQDLRELSKNNIVKLGVEWQNGYQEYEVYNQSLIKNQLNCLNKIK